MTFFGAYRKIILFHIIILSGCSSDPGLLVFPGNEKYFKEVYEECREKISSNPLNYEAVRNIGCGVLSQRFNACLNAGKDPVDCKASIKKAYEATLNVAKIDEPPKAGSRPAKEKTFTLQVAATEPDATGNVNISIGSPPQII